MNAMQFGKTTCDIKIAEVLVLEAFGPFLGTETARQHYDLHNEIVGCGRCTPENRALASHLMEDALLEVWNNLKHRQFVSAELRDRIRKEIAQKRDPRSVNLVRCYKTIAKLCDKALREEELTLQKYDGVQHLLSKKAPNTPEADDSEHYYKSIESATQRSNRIEMAGYYKYDRRRGKGVKRDKFALWASRQQPTRHKRIKLARRQPDQLE